MRKIIQLMILCSITLLVLLLLSPTIRVTAGRSLPVHVHPGGDVDYEVVNISKSAGDEVVWVSDGDQITITFPTSPFTASSFQIAAGGSVSSGPVRADAAPDHYRYFISDETTGTSVDPDVNIKH